MYISFVRDINVHGTMVDICALSGGGGGKSEYVDKKGYDGAQTAWKDIEPNFIRKYLILPLRNM